MPVRDSNDAMAATLVDIARQHLRLDSLETVGSDSEDFHDLSTAAVRGALRAAYLAGRASHDGDADNADGIAVREDGGSAGADAEPQPLPEPETPGENAR
jgi:hypothetical protein